MTPENVRHAFIAADGATLRSRPDKDASLIANLPVSTDVEVLLTGNQSEQNRSLSWYKTRYGGKVGWTQGAYLFVINEETPEKTIAKYKEQIVPLRVKERFVSDLTIGVKPELMLHEDGSFDMTINRCEGMEPVSGKYVSTDRTLFLYGFVSKWGQRDRVSQTILSGVILELDRTSSTTLTVINDFVYDAVTEKYGFCAPNKGEHFVASQ